MCHRPPGRALRRPAVVPLVLPQGAAARRPPLRRGRPGSAGVPGRGSPQPRDLRRRLHRDTGRRAGPHRPERLAELCPLPRRGRADHRRVSRRALPGVRAMTERREPGPRSRAIVERERRVAAAGMQGFALYAGLAMARGQGSTLIDEDGQEYIDFIAGITIGSVGHCHPHYVEALKRQVEKLTFGSFTTETRTRFLEMLASLTPEGLTRIQMFSGGAEAVEAALRLAKAAAGNIVPPEGFLRAVQQIAEEAGALLLCDEMITGIGRTGSMWGSDHDQVVPDIMTVGKGVGGGFPLSAVVSTEELTSKKPWSNPSASSSSYGGNPLAAAAGLASLEIILKENLVKNADRVGAVMLKRLEALKEKHRVVGEVRGRGLLLGIELVKDRRTKEPLGKDVTQALYQECLRRGLAAMTYSATVRINPPLMISEEAALAGLAILDEALEAVVREHNLQ